MELCIVFSFSRFIELRLSGVKIRLNIGTGRHDMQFVVEMSSERILLEVLRT